MLLPAKTYCNWYRHEIVVKTFVWTKYVTDLSLVSSNTHFHATTDHATSVEYGQKYAKTLFIYLFII